MANAAIFYDKRTASSVTATTAQAGYPAGNVALESLARPWYSTDATANDVTINFAATVGVHSIFLHDVNFTTCTVQKSVDGAVWVTVGVLTTYADRYGRRRGRITINDATVKGIRIQIASGTPADGLTYWRIGAAYPMGTTHTPPADLIFPVNEEVVEPAVATELPNSLVAEAATGTRFSRIETTWQRESTELLATLMTKSAGTVVFDAGTSDYPEQQWPVYRLRRDGFHESFDRFRFSKPSVKFTERV